MSQEKPATKIFINNLGFNRINLFFMGWTIPKS